MNVVVVVVVVVVPPPSSSDRAGTETVDRCPGSEPNIPPIKDVVWTGVSVPCITRKVLGQVKPNTRRSVSGCAWSVEERAGWI